MTISEADFLDCVCDELTSHGGTVDRDRIAAELFGPDDFDLEYAEWCDRNHGEPDDAEIDRMVLLSHG